MLAVEELGGSTLMELRRLLRKEKFPTAISLCENFPTEGPFTDARNAALTSLGLRGCWGRELVAASNDNSRRRRDMGSVLAAESPLNDTSRRRRDMSDFSGLPTARSSQEAAEDRGVRVTPGCRLLTSRAPGSNGVLGS